MELDDLVPEPLRLDVLQHQLGFSIERLDLDGPLPSLTVTEGAKSRPAILVEMARRDGMTVRELARVVAASRGHFLAVGDPPHVADTMQEWFLAGACHGFFVVGATRPASLRAFTEQVLPMTFRTPLTEKPGAPPSPSWNDSCDLATRPARRWSLVLWRQQGRPTGRSTQYLRPSTIGHGEKPGHRIENWPQGKDRGPLHGIPFGVKDVFDVSGSVTTCQSWVSPGASSSGSGVIVAAHVLPFVLGTDTNGSVRGPAAACGVVGLKPTFGRVPRSGAFPCRTCWTM